MAEKEIINGQYEQQINRPQVERPPEIMRDLQKDKEAFVPREVQSWMEKVEDNVATDDSVMPSIVNTTNPKIVLPTTRQSFSDGFNKTVGDAGRWLSEFVFRLIKKNEGNVKFKEE